MTTFDQLVDTTLMQLESYGLTQSMRVPLPLDIDEDTITIGLSTLPAGIGAGLAEIDSELVLVSTVQRDVSISDDVTASLSVTRGFRSTAVAHTAGTSIVFSPTWPRVTVANALNDAIVGSYPTLFGVADTTLTSNAVNNTYDLDALDDGVLQARWLPPGPSNEWLDLTNFKFDKDMSKWTVWDAMMPAQEIKLVTRRKPIRLALTDDFSVSGLQDSAQEYVRLMACSKLVANIDAGQMPNQAAAPNSLSPSWRPGVASSTISTSLYRLAQMELLHERQRLLTDYPPTVRYPRRGGFYR